MTSVVFSVFLLLQTGGPVVTGRISVEGDAPAPSSITLPVIAGPTSLLPAGVNPTLIIRPQIDGTFRVQVQRIGEYRLGTAGGLPPGYTVQSIVYGSVDVMRNPLKVSLDDSAELLITLAVSGPPPTVSVSGHVTGIPPGQFLRISLREPSGGYIGAALETSIGSDGSFTFPKVLPGAYIVYLRLRSVTQVMVGNKDVTGLIVAHPQDILVSGHVITEGAQSAPPAVIIEGNGKAATMPVRPNGTFILSLEKGENSISLRNIPQAYSLKSMTYGDADLLKQPLKLDGPAIWDIIVRLAPKN